MWMLLVTMLAPALDTSVGPKSAAWSFALGALAVAAPNPAEAAAAGVDEADVPVGAAGLVAAAPTLGGEGVGALALVADGAVWALDTRAGVGTLARAHVAAVDVGAVARAAGRLLALDAGALGWAAEIGRASCRERV